MNLTLTLVPWQLWHMFVKRLIHLKTFILTNIIFLKIQYFSSQKNVLVIIFWGNFSSFLKIKAGQGTTVCTSFSVYFMLNHCAHSLFTMVFAKCNVNQGFFNDNLGHVFTCSDISFAWCHFESLAFTLPCDQMVVRPLLQQWPQWDNFNKIWSQGHKHHTNMHVIVFVFKKSFLQYMNLPGPE